MKKIILTVFALAVTLTAFGQKNPLKRAENELKKGDLAAAKASIEEAMTNEKTKDEADLWLVRGDIYRAMMNKGDDTAFDEVVKSYKKFTEVGKKGFFPMQADSATRGLYAQVMNDGIVGYNDKDWARAMKGFDRGAVIMPGDTLALQNYLAAAENEDPAKVDRAKVMQKCEEFINVPTYKGDRSWVYQKVISMHLAEDPDDKSGKALAMLDRAIAAYPTIQEFMAQKINIYIKANKTDEAIKAIEDVIAKGGNNLELYYLNLGILHDTNKNAAKAEEAYKKALEIKPDYYEALFNLGAFYVNKDEKLKKYREFDYKKLNTPEGKQLTEELKALFVSAIPYLEKAANFTDKAEYGQVLNTLKDAYNFTGQKDKATALQSKIDAYYNSK
jgi:tetratricopeptide (TPR) repeat protein